MQQAFGEPVPANGLNSALSQIWRIGNYRRYVEPRTRLPAILGFSFFAGDLRLSNVNGFQHGQGDIMHLWRRVRDVADNVAFKTVLADLFTYKAHKDCQSPAAEMSIIRNGVELWKGTTKPDAVLAPPGAQGSWTELVTEETACARRLRQRGICAIPHLLWHKKTYIKII